MAKTLGAKSILICQAITEYSDKGNTELAQLLNDADERMDDKIKVTPQDVAQQRQRMKKAGTLLTGKKRGRPAGQPAKQPVTSALAALAPTNSPVDLIDKTIDLAQQCRGIEQLRKLVGRMARMANG